MKNTHHNSSNTLLVEIMMAVLFFALCASLLMQLFTAVRMRSEAAGMTAEAMVPARSITETLNHPCDRAAALEKAGFKPLEQDVWQLKLSEKCSITVKLGEERMPNGRLLTAEISAERLPGTANAEVLFTLPSACYQAAEVE